MKINRLNFNKTSFLSFNKTKYVKPISFFIINKPNLMCNVKCFSSKKKDKEESMDNSFANGKYKFEEMFYNHKDEYSMEYNVRMIYL